MGYLTGLLSDVIQYFFSLTGNYGWAIIILTVILRILIAPAQHMQIASTRRTKEIEPLRKEIEKRYKGDPRRIQEETMRLYRSHKINPFAGCLPLLIQIPIIWAFFGALRSLEYVGVPAFLWVADLSKPDPWILPVLAGVTTFLQSKLTLPAPTDGDTTSQTMLYLMPLLIIWMSRSFAAGISLYWVASNIFAILQQLVYPAGKSRDRKPKEAVS
ncbi:MAG: protein translocase component YidC [Bacillota bacterium]|nr:MAG: protein translocase component YidC [Bacillota bacterium]